MARRNPAAAFVYVVGVAVGFVSTELAGVAIRRRLMTLAFALATHSVAAAVTVWLVVR